MEPLNFDKIVNPIRLEEQNSDKELSFTHYRGIMKDYTKKCSKEIIAFSRSQDGRKVN